MFDLNLLPLNGGAHISGLRTRNLFFFVAWSPPVSEGPHVTIGFAPR